MSLDLTKEQLYIAEIYKITLRTGKELFLTNFGKTERMSKKLPVIDKHMYEPVPIKRDKIKFYTELKVDIVNITFGIQAFTIEGKSIIQAIDYGWFDGAGVTITQVNPDDVAQQREIFRGNVNKGIRYNRKEVKLSVTSILDLLKKEVPRIMYQEQCNHKLFDSYCGLSKSSYKETDSAEAGSTNIKIYNSSIFGSGNHSLGYFELGELKMTSGNSNGISKPIRTHNDGDIILYETFKLGISVGDSFEVYPGCDKSGTTCNDKFSNYTPNFLGFEYIPRPDILM